LDIKETLTDFELKIHDVSGKLLYAKKNATLSRGKYVFPINLEFAPSGYTFISVQTPNNIKTIKALKQSKD